MTAPRVVKVTVIGAFRTKKTHNQIVSHSGRIRVLPSKAWQDWCKKAPVVGHFVTPVPGMPGKFAAMVGSFPVSGDVNCRALFYRDANRGDAVGFYQGLADLLEKRGVLVNDRQIVSWDGSRLLKDAANPRVEIELTEVTP